MKFLLQFQSDILGAEVERPVIVETTALGAAFLAGLAVGFWKNRAEIATQWNKDKTFKVTMDDATRDKLYTGWKKAVKASMAFK